MNKHRDYCTVTLLLIRFVKLKQELRVHHYLSMTKSVQTWFKLIKSLKAYSSPPHHLNPLAVSPLYHLTLSPSHPFTISPPHISPPSPSHPLTVSPSCAGTSASAWGRIPSPVSPQAKEVACLWTTGVDRLSNMLLTGKRKMFI